MRREGLSDEPGTMRYVREWTNERRVLVLDTLNHSVEIRRKRVNGLISPRTRAEFGQYMTPASVAEVLARCIDLSREHVRLLDPGAGIGSLTSAVAARILNSSQRPETLSLTCYEIDPAMQSHLQETLEECVDALRGVGVDASYEIVPDDFLRVALDGAPSKNYTAAILNPPFMKIPAKGQMAERLRARGWSVANYYTAFWSVAIDQVEDGGDIVAITPRSFCNGSYFQGFRRYLLRESGVKLIHVFETRNEAFSEDGVLQETVVTHSVRGVPLGPVELVLSKRADGAEFRRKVRAEEVVDPDDPAAFIRLPVDDGAEAVRQWMSMMTTTLEDLEVAVSTGPVVDFRMRDHLRDDPESGTVPLLYPTHLADGTIRWPREGGRKPNAFVRNGAEKLISPDGPYVLVKRFSAKEERRRVVASYYSGTLGRPDGSKAAAIAFENHLNYFHRAGQPLPDWLARGLTMFLNSTVVDQYFRQFNGHTQVNAGDLRSLRYPTLEALRKLATLWMPGLSQGAIDDAVNPLAAVQSRETIPPHLD